MCHLSNKDGDRLNLSNEGSSHLRNTMQESVSKSLFGFCDCACDRDPLNISGG